MPDAFFHSDKKRKRPSQGSAGPSSRGSRGSRGGSRGGGGGRGSRGGGRGSGRGGGQGSSRPSRGSREERDEDLSSESEAGGGDFDTMDFRAGREEVALDDDEVVDENETAAEKRIRLAKGYLAKVKQDLEAERQEADYDAAEIDRELIASRLQKDVVESQGRIHTFLASQISSFKSRLLSTPSQLPTAIALTPTSLFISTKRGTIFRYSLPSLSKVGKPFGQDQTSAPTADTPPVGHRGEILCLAASEDGKFLVSGGRDKVVGVWNVESEEAKWVTGMRGHKDAITSVCIPPLDNPAHHILTASLSRHLALASLSTLSVIDTFFGHQDSITSVSALKPSAAVTAGSRDRTCRWWKVEEEVQLVLRGGGRTFEGIKGTAPEPRKERLGGGWEEEKEEDVEKRKEIERERKQKGKGREFVEGSIDCVCMLDDQHFVSGGDSGSIALWNIGKKKPIFTHPFAHGIDDLTTESDLKGARWITSLTALRGTNLFASGSWDGSIRLWALDQNLRSFRPASAATHEIPINGFINSLQILSLPSGSIDSSSWRSGGILDGLDTNAVAESSEQAIPTSKQEIVLVAAVGQEPRLGRWMREKAGIKNGALIVHLKLDS